MFYSKTPFFNKKKNNMKKKDSMASPVKPDEVLGQT